MKAAISINNLAHQKQHAAAMKAGLQRHGLRVILGPTGHPDHIVSDADFHVVWGVHRRDGIIEWSKANGKPFLVMERGHVGDRTSWTSCGWNGLGRRGHYATANDDGARWQQWAHLMQPWKHGGECVVVMGQVPSDQQVASLRRFSYGKLQGFYAWVQETIDALVNQGHRVVFRPHPLAAKFGFPFAPTGAEYSKCTLAEDLSRAACCVTFNSTVGVESVLAGVPTVTVDEGAMAWDVAGHKLSETIRPDRERWAHNLAWTQWSLEEISNGTAWDYLKSVNV